MNAHTDAQITEVQRIERALDELLKVALSARAPWPRRHPHGISAGDLIREALDGTPAERAARALLDNPVGEAVRQGVRTLGERLHELGGVQLMQDVLYRVAEIDPASTDHRVSVMDKRWDGIGVWLA